MPQGSEIYFSVCMFPVSKQRQKKYLKSAYNCLPKLPSSMPATQQLLFNMPAHGNPIKALLKLPVRHDYIVTKDLRGAR